MDNEKQNPSTPASNPDSNQGETKKVRFDEPVEEKERLWKHESEIPDASNRSTGKSESGERSDSN